MNRNDDYHSAPKDPGDAWIELNAEDAVRELGADADSHDPGRVLSLLLAEPSTRAFLRVEATPAGATPSLGYLVAGTRIFINKSQLTDLRGDVVAGLAVWTLSQSLTWSAAVGLFHKATRSVRRLSHEELELLKLMLELAEGDRPVAIEAIASRYEGDRRDLDRELAGLTRRGVVWAEGDGWRIAP